jgi:hypothetical protein
MTRKEMTRRNEQADRLSQYGITWEEAEQLRRDSMRLHRWAEMECNHDVQRDEKTGKPTIRYCRHDGTISRPIPIPDRETPALARCKAIADRHGLIFYHQSDPRGAAVYIGKAEDLRGADVHSAYSRLVCVY